MCGEGKGGSSVEVFLWSIEFYTAFSSNGDFCGLERCPGLYTSSPSDKIISNSCPHNILSKVNSSLHVPFYEKITKFQFLILKSQKKIKGDQICS